MWIRRGDEMYNLDQVVNIEILSVAPRPGIGRGQEYKLALWGHGGDPAYDTLITSPDREECVRILDAIVKALIFKESVLVFGVLPPETQPIQPSQP